MNLRPIEIDSGKEKVEGWFHTWSYQSDGEGGTNTYALCETKSGEIREVYVNYIKFLDR